MDKRKLLLCFIITVLAFGVTLFCYVFTLSTVCGVLCTLTGISAGAELFIIAFSHYKSRSGKRADKAAKKALKTTRVTALAAVPNTDSK